MSSHVNAEEEKGIIGRVYEITTPILDIVQEFCLLLR